MCSWVRRQLLAELRSSLNRNSPGANRAKSSSTAAAGAQRSWFAERTWFQISLTPSLRPLRCPWHPPLLPRRPASCLRGWSLRWLLRGRRWHVYAATMTTRFLVGVDHAFLYESHSTTPLCPRTYMAEDHAAWGYEVQLTTSLVQWRL